MKKIVIIGCGPKALAIYAKAKVLGVLGYSVPEIVIIEKNDVGANWSGSYGYTDGKAILGISPFKDIGFPYESKFGKEVDEAMVQYSFITHLKKENRFTAWVDGGILPIRHSDFARYLNWLVKVLDIKIIFGEVFKLNASGDKWEVLYKTKENEEKIICDSVVVTGPGGVRKTVDYPQHPKIYDAKDFWLRVKEFNNLFNEKIAIVGGGTSSGSMFERLMPLLDVGTHVDWHTRRGLFTRSENFSNNQFFSYPEDWENLPEDFRMQFIQHTDGGSIEGSTNQIMSQYQEYFSTIYSEPKRIYIENEKLVLEYQTTNGLFHKVYDRIILATGFDNTYFLDWLPTEFKQKNNLNLNEFELAQKLNNDLTLSTLSPNLHLPMLSYYKYGIGLRNLSCLSTLADLILGSYVKK